MKNSQFEKSVLAGEGNIFVSAGLASELYTASDQSTLDIATFASEARAATKLLKTGDNTPLVDKLASQLHLLDVLFTRTTQLAIDQKIPERMIELMDMALKIQNNSRRTASAINELTHPKASVNYIRTNTANLAENQQINYSEKSIENELNKGESNEMDQRSQSSSGRANQTMETVASFNRAVDERG